jgi:hypothetical protein
MISKLLMSLAIGVAIAGAAVAQQPPANPSAPSNPAVSTPGQNATTPAPGANSFTEAQAKKRIEDQGLTNVNGLTKDADGVWRGSASRSGQTLSVAVDYQGNVVTK